MTKKKIIALVSSMVSLLLIAGIGLAAWTITQKGTTANNSQTLTGGATEPIITSGYDPKGNLTLDTVKGGTSYAMIFDQPTKTGETTNYLSGIYIVPLSDGVTVDSYVEEDKKAAEGDSTNTPVADVDHKIYMTYTIPTADVIGSEINDFEYIVKVTITGSIDQYITYNTDSSAPIDTTKSKVDESNTNICTFYLTSGTASSSGVKVTKNESGSNYVYDLEYNLTDLFKYKAKVDTINSESAVNDLKTAVSSSTIKLEFTINSVNNNA